MCMKKKLLNFKSHSNVQYLQFSVLTFSYRQLPYKRLWREERSWRAILVMTSGQTVQRSAVVGSTVALLITLSFKPKATIFHYDQRRKIFTAVLKG